MNRRLLRESKRQQEIVNDMRKEEAEIARKQWMLSEYQKMVAQIQDNKHTFQDFTRLVNKFAQPFEHRSKDGYVTMCTSNENVCITGMALQAIDGVLCQKRQAEEIAQVTALRKKRNSTKRKRTPNTTRGDDGIGIYMGLQDHDMAMEQEKRANEKERLEKESSSLDKILQEFSTLKSKNGGTIDFETCKAAELSTLLSITGLAKGSSNKAKEVKKQILRDNNITNEKLTLCFNDGTTRLAKMKEKLAGRVVVRDSEGSTVVRREEDTEPGNSDDEHSLFQ